MSWNGEGRETKSRLPILASFIPSSPFPPRPPPAQKNESKTRIRMWQQLCAAPREDTLPRVRGPPPGSASCSSDASRGGRLISGRPRRISKSRVRFSRRPRGKALSHLLPLAPRALERSHVAIGTPECLEGTACTQPLYSSHTRGTLLG